MNEFLPEGRMSQRLGVGSIAYSLNDLKDAYEKGTVLEGRVLLCDKEHNMFVNLGAMKGVIPREEGAIGINDGTVRDIALISKVNKNVCFKIVDFIDQPDGTLAVLSRRAVQLDCKRKYVDTLQKGQVIDARITHLEKFGAFVDIGAGINALIPIDMISVSRIPHPNERFRENQDIRAVVRNVEGGKITLSHRELLGTWEENAQLFAPGETVPGIIRSVEDYGIFVELTPNLAGLAEIVGGVKAGQRASVYIKSIIPERMKLKLVIVDSFSADYEKDESRYFFNENKMDSWHYSPECCDKVIETIF